MHVPGKVASGHTVTHSDTRIICHAMPAQPVSQRTGPFPFPQSTHARTICRPTQSVTHSLARSQPNPTNPDTPPLPLVHPFSASPHLCFHSADDALTHSTDTSDPLPPACRLPVSPAKTLLLSADRLPKDIPAPCRPLSPPAVTCPLPAVRRRTQIRPTD